MGKIRTRVIEMGRSKDKTVNLKGKKSMKIMEERTWR